MHKNYKNWEKLFLFCLGLFLGSMFCMKWMEKDLTQGGKLFSVINLELIYSKEKVFAILSGLDERVKTILQYHLYFDFAFMAGVFPGIAALCMMARYKTSGVKLKRVLLLLAFGQLIAWACDIIENTFLLAWVSNPEKIRMFSAFHFIVWTKWILAIFGAVLSIPLVIGRKKSHFLI